MHLSPTLALVLLLYHCRCLCLAIKQRQETAREYSQHIPADFVSDLWSQDKAKENDKYIHWSSLDY